MFVIISCLIVGFCIGAIIGHCCGYGRAMYELSKDDNLKQSEPLGEPPCLAWREKRIRIMKD